jgi:hypothetical protein
MATGVSEGAMEIATEGRERKRENVECNKMVVEGGKT